ncbi:MAG TPA: ABC transporter permease [Nocardioidaceae bacterium]|nr:ABC transporter permease [Nocardioidaceae bacterium]
MTVIPQQERPAGATRAKAWTWPRVLLAVGVTLVAVAALRAVTDAEQIFTSGTLRTAVAAAVPIGLAGLGGLWSERAGVINIGLEGMMILGTWGAGYGGYVWGPWGAVVLGMVCGALGGLLHAMATVSFGVDHIVSGVAINIIALGAAQYLAALAFTGLPQGGPTQSPPIPSLPNVTVPGISEAALWLEDRGWFALSELGALLAAVTTSVSALTVVALALFAATAYLLWHTAFGLRLRSCGENPVAAESLGVSVYLYKYVAITVSGAMAGLGGAFLAIVAAGIYRDGQTGGRGYIGLASMIFGNWRPSGVLTGAGLFGYTETLGLRSGPASVHALLLLLGLGLVVIALWQLARRRPAVSGIAMALGLLVVWIYLVTDVVPAEFTSLTPYITTLLVLSLAAQRLRPPAGIGGRYRRGEVM